MDNLAQQSADPWEFNLLNHAFRTFRPALIFCLCVVMATYAFAVPLQGGSPSEIENLLKKGDELFKAAKFREAVEKYKEVLARDANNDHATGYIAYSFSKLGDRAQARQWMHKRAELPGQNPSVKAQALTDIALLCWDEAHMSLAARLVGGKTLKPEEVAGIERLLDEGIQSAQQATPIAPHSVKGLNVLNLLYRARAEGEADVSQQKAHLAKADEAMRQAIKLFEATPNAPTNDLFAVPTMLVSSTVDTNSSFASGQPIKAVPLMSADPNDKAMAAIEVFVGLDGKVKFLRAIVGESKKVAPALSAARQWEFQPSTFEGHTVQVTQVLTFGGDATTQSPAAGRPMTPVNETLDGKVIDHIERGDQLLRAGKVDEALGEFKAASQAAGKPVYTALLRIGGVYMQKEDYRAAADAYRQASTLYPQDPASQYNLAEALYAAGEYKQAEAAYRKTLDLSPGRVNSQAHHFLGLSLYNQKRLDEAIAEYRIAIDQARSDYSEARYNLGIALLASGKLQAAESEFRMAIQQEKHDWPEAHFNLATTLEHQHRSREAADEYETYLRQSPNATDAAATRKRIEQLRSPK
ncbi:MAG: hypothetical protein V7641_3139 [Blastocatellia bacterium]